MQYTTILPSFTVCQMLKVDNACWYTEKPIKLSKVAEFQEHINIVVK